MSMYDERLGFENAKQRIPPSKFKMQFFDRECLLTRLPRLKCIRLSYVRSSHLPSKVYQIGFHAFKCPYVNASWVNSNTPFDKLHLRSQLQHDLTPLSGPITCTSVTQKSFHERNIPRSFLERTPSPCLHSGLRPHPTQASIP